MRPTHCAECAGELQGAAAAIYPGGWALAWCSDECLRRSCERSLGKESAIKTEPAPPLEPELDEPDPECALCGYSRSAHTSSPQCHGFELTEPSFHGKHFA